VRATQSGFATGLPTTFKNASLFAQFEREVIGERIRDKFAASRKKGMWMGGWAPLGYRVENRRLIVDTAEAEKVRWIFTRYVQTGSVTTVVKELTAQGFINKYGQRLDKGRIYKLLNNRVYLGEAVHKGTPYPGEHDAIVSKTMWDKVHAAMAEGARAKAGRTRFRARDWAGVPVFGHSPSSAAVAISQEISIALVDDHPVVVEGVAAVVATRPGYRIVAKGSSAADARVIVKIPTPKTRLSNRGNARRCVKTGGILGQNGEGWSRVSLPPPATPSEVFSGLDVAASNAAAPRHFGKRPVDWLA
jgi:hypothetical protein